MPLVLAVPAKSPYDNVAQWVAALRANKAMTFASAGVGTPGHLAGEMLKLKLDNKLVHVPYKGAGPALNDVAAGQVDFYFPAYPSAVPLSQGGKIKLLAVSTVKRSTASPDIPTVAEATGISDFDFPLWVGFFGPHGMPMDVTQKLNTAINKIILEPAINARLKAIGPEVSALSIDQFTAFVRTDIAKYREIIKAGNLKPD
jgi:tripartite-type tricarboxylate transporter receptor subunit TctC